MIVIAQNGEYTTWRAQRSKRCEIQCTTGSAFVTLANNEVSSKEYDIRMGFVHSIDDTT
ncbi:hypothetical protein GCM10011404_28220 [Sphingomonas prati]|nr:hypothetical protein GCM10011404_28220 [Sphingomonas prati]